MAKNVTLPVLRLLPRTEKSIPWGAADRGLVPIDLKRYGYLEAEYLFSGKANVYTLQEERAVVQYADAPYTNRFLIRWPSDPARFSGNVVIELLNPSNMWDVSPMWSQVWPKMLHDGDVYVGVTMRPVSARALLRYDPVRYAPLNWTSPAPGPICQDILMWEHGDPSTEFGLFWDMLTQLGWLMKSAEGETLIGAPVEKVYAMGCSQSSMFLTTYLNVFHESDRPSPVEPPFDGYLCFTGSVLTALNQKEAPPKVQAPISMTRNCPVPVIRIMSQWDFGFGSGALCQRRLDSDAPGDRFRLYEMAGCAHNSYVGALYRPGYEEIAAIERTTEVPETDMPPLPVDAIMRQALRNLDAWERDGIAPPRAPGWIEVDEYGKAVFDADGNCKGGLRLPQLTVPIGRYYSGTATNPQNGAFVPFSEEKLRQLYPTHGAYVRKMFAAIDDLLAQNFLSVEDADEQKRLTVMTPVPALERNAPHEA